MLQVVTVGGKVPGKPVKKIRAPRLVVHFIHRFYQSSTEERSPHSIHDDTGKPAVFLLRHEVGQLLEPHLTGGLWVYFTKLRVEEVCGHLIPRGLVTTMLFHGGISEDGGKGVGLVEGPVVDEAVVTGCALEVEPEKDLSNILGSLHLYYL